MTQPGCVDGYKNYLGIDDSEYQDWFGVVGRSRDSGILEESNFAKALEMLGGDGDNVRVERYGHWACGWIEEVYVRPGTPECLIAEEIERKLDNYPILDEDDFGRRETDEAARYWAILSIADRIELCKRFGVCIFAARRDEVPSDDTGGLEAYLCS